MIFPKLKVFSTLIFSMFVFSTQAIAEEIHFDNDIYTLKYSTLSPVLSGYVNEYYLKNENGDNFTKGIGIYYYPNVASPIKFAEDFEKTVEATENSILLKLVENKKQDKAVLSFLVNNSINNKKFFEYNIYKYEKHPNQGMMVMKYSQRYSFNTDDEITKIGNKIRDEEDKFLTMIATSSIPPIVEQENLGD